MVVDDIVDLVGKEVKLLGKFVEIDKSNAFDLCENFLLLVLEVIESYYIFSQEDFVNTKDRQVLQNFKSET